MRRTTIIGTAASAALILALSGCGGSTPTDAESKGKPSASSAPVKDPGQAVADAFQKSTETSFKFELTDPDGTFSGVYDAKSKGLSMSGTVDGDPLETIVIDGVIYVKGLADPPNENKWVRIEGFKDSPYSTSDPLGTLKLLTTATTVEAAGDMKYKGVIDLAKVATSSDKALKAVGETALRWLGDKPKTVPFEVTLDSEGRIADYQVDMPTVGGKLATSRLKMSQYGTDAAVTAPPASETMTFDEWLK